MTLTDEGLIRVPGLSSQWVRLGGGAKAHYMAAGDEGPAVVLLHGGLPGSSGIAGWRFMAPFLGANGFRVYCPDLPAFGLSDEREEYWPRGFESFVDFVQEFATALCLDAFHLGGNSTGCSASVLYACAHPERVRSLALIAGDVGDVIPGPRESFPPPPFDGTPESMQTMLQAIVHHEEKLDDDLIEMRTRSANRHQAAFVQLRASIAAGGGRVGQNTANAAARLMTKGRLDRLTIPAVYFYGQQDALTPVTWGYAQEQVLPNIQFFYPDDCGHQGQTDQPELFNQAFLEFFRDGAISGAIADAAGISTRRPELGVISR